MRYPASPIGKLGALLCGAVVATALAGPAQARPPGPHFGDGPGPAPEERIERIVERLDLSDDQSERLRSLFGAHREQTETLRAEAEAAHERLEARVDDAELDEAAIREAAAELAAAQTELFLARARMHQEMRQILTPEQFEQMVRMRETHRKRMRFSDGPRGGGGFRQGRGGPPPQDG